VTRALRALSSTYVERRIRGGRDAGAVRGALDGAGKRAAFALYYGPLHFLAVHAIVHALGAWTARGATATILDLGCGTGAAGAAWAVASAASAVHGFDRHPWAVEEARWTYRHFGLDGRATRSDLSRLPPPRDGLIAAYILNELSGDHRIGLARRLAERAAGGERLLIVEPIARSVAPWWDGLAASFLHVGARVDEWRLPIRLPPLLERLDTATGLDHRVLTARSIYSPGSGAPLERHGPDRP
jgi:hypothetical protein